jgi:hypothetical protein
VVLENASTHLGQHDAAGYPNPLGFTLKVSSFNRKMFHIFLVGVYGALFLWQLRFLEVDACLDAGGAIDAATGNCIGGRPGEYLPLLARPWPLWLISALLPAIPVAIFGFLGSKVSRAKARAVPNK